MTKYQVEIIHPTPAADFTMLVSAPSKNAAYNIAYRRTQDQFGADTLHMVGNVQTAS